LGADSEVDNREVISWNEFKVFRTVCKQRRKDLCNFLKNHFELSDEEEKEEKEEKEQEDQQKKH